MIKKQKKRSEISNEFKWDLSELIKNEKEFNSLYLEVENLLKKMIQYKGKILESSSSLYEFLKLDETVDIKLDVLIYYSHNLYNADTTDNKSLSLKLKLDNIEKIMSELSFVKNEYLDGEEKIKTYLKENKDLKEYKQYFNDLFRFKNHKLNDENEELISKISTGLINLSEIFSNINNADVNFGNIKDEEGNLVELTHGNYIKFITSKKRSVRKDTFEALNNYYKNLKNTIASIYRGEIKKHYAFSKIRNYDDTLSVSLFEDNISKKVYLNLIDSIHDGLKYMSEYIKIKRKLLNIKDFHMYDIYINPVKEIDIKIPYKESQEIIEKALEPLGKQYITDLKKAFSDKWIDVYPNLGKRSGAYSAGGCTTTHPYILMNYDDTLHSVSTLIHELGHAMHSYYSNKTQNQIYQDYTIFLAEIASTVNELLLNEYLSRNARTKKEKIYYIIEFLEKVRTTIYRQTMFAEFEMLMHNNEKNNVPLTEEEFSNKYYELNKLYYGENIIHDDLIRYEWSRIPHFYTPFYVYKYATGLSYAMVIVSKLLNNEKGFKEKYLEFLSSGSKDYSANLLKNLGIDIEDNSVVDNALKIFKEKIDELKIL